MRKNKLMLLFIFTLLAAVLVGAFYMFFNFRKEKVFYYKADDGVYPNPYM